MQGFDTIFGLVVDTENTYEYTGDVYGLLHEYTRYKVIGVMLVSFNNMEFKQVNLGEFQNIRLNNYASNNLAENKWTSFLYPYDTEPVIIVDRYKYSGSNLIENVKTVRSYEDENDIILLYDKDGKLIVRSGCDIIRYDYSEQISLTVDLHTHSIGFSLTQRLSDNLAKTSVRKNYFNHVGDIYYNVLNDVLTCGTKHVLVCEDIVEVCADCDKILLPSECRTLYLDDGVAVNQIVCNKEIEHIVSCTDYPVGEWYISKESLVNRPGSRRCPGLAPVGQSRLRPEDPRLRGNEGVAGQPCLRYSASACPARPGELRLLLGDRKGAGPGGPVPFRLPTSRTPLLHNLMSWTRCCPDGNRPTD